jgi:acyl-CoA synthetase (AMP-forming)/AMP-acid ligase II
VSNTFHDLVTRDDDRVALVDGATGAEVTYTQLSERANRVAARLADGGFGPGDVLALQAPNVPAWAGIALGAMRLGGAVTGVPVTATEAEVARQTADAGARSLITAADIVPALLSAAGEPPRPRVASDTVALLPYSSGTSGLPKGVMLTHANLVAAVRQAQSGLRLTPDDTVAALAPFSHVMGFVISLGVALAAGARVLTVPRFEPRGFVELLERHRASIVIVPPPVMRLLARSPRDLPDAELIVSGGAPLGPELQRAVAARFPQAAVGQGYGLTETTAVVTIPDRAAGTVPGSCGRVAPDTEVRLADGELLVRGPQTMAGYLNRPEATAEMIDADGWVHTGDLARIDDDGNVFVVDRVKELIKVNAWPVAPAELEALLGTHPAVADCAVVGRPDERYGEVPVGVVVARGDADPGELLAFVAERVAPHKRLHAVRFVESIPRTPAGKTLRRVLDVGRHGRRPSKSEGRRTEARGT